MTQGEKRRSISPGWSIGTQHQCHLHINLAVGLTKCPSTTCGTRSSKLESLTELCCIANRCATLAATERVQVRVGRSVGIVELLKLENLWFSVVGGSYT